MHNKSFHINIDYQDEILILNRTTQKVLTKLHEFCLSFIVVGNIIIVNNL